MDNEQNNNNVNPNMYVLRNNDDLFIPQSRLVLTDKFPLVYYPTLWCNLDNYDIKIQRNKNVFNNKLKEYFLQKLKTDYECGRLLCPHCHLGR